MSVFSFYFGWPEGAVYSNLLASGICASLVYWRARVHMRRSHDSLKAQMKADSQKHAERHIRTQEMLAKLHQRLAEISPEKEEG